MPLELASALSIEREPVADPEIRVQALESIYLLVLQVRLSTLLIVHIEIVTLFNQPVRNFTRNLLPPLYAPF